MAKRAVLLLGIAGAVAGCFPFAGDSTARTGDQPVAQAITESDRKAGAAAHPQLLAEFGGAYDGAQANYVRAVGQKIAFQSGIARSPSDFTITLLNSPVNNAFAIPGGYVYVTRQLLALMNDEAELASVLGHEVGHVAARHSQKRQNAATRNTILGALGQMLAGAVLGDSGIGSLLQEGIGSGAQLLTLKFSRSQEYEADDLGIVYLARAGYDPAASSTMLASLANQSALDARLRGQDARNLPEWASTHPDPAGRVVRARTQAAKQTAAGKLRNREAFLAAVDGVLYDDDPHQGIIDGNRFRHPDLRLGFDAPPGYAMSNGTTAVSITGPSGQAQFGGGSAATGSLRDYVAKVFADLGGGNGLPGRIAISDGRINGLATSYATTRANSRSGPVDVSVIAYDAPLNRRYHFIVLTRAGAGVGPFQPMINSLRALSDQDVRAIRPRRLQVVTVRSGDTPASLAERMAYADRKLERFQVINALPANARLQPGQKVKIITY